MNTAVINVKTHPETKTQAQQVAQKLGVSLSALVNAFLHHMIETKRVEFSLDEKPSKYLKAIIKRARKERKQGKSSPIFDTAEDAIAWLHKQDA